MIMFALVSIVLFSLLVASIAKLGAGSVEWLGTPWTAPREWTRPWGVQEDDLPRFVFRDVPAPRPPKGTPPAVQTLSGLTLVLRQTGVQSSGSW